MNNEIEYLINELMSYNFMKQQHTTKNTDEQYSFSFRIEEIDKKISKLSTYEQRRIKDIFINKLDRNEVLNDYMLSNKITNKSIAKYLLKNEILEILEKMI